jgi:hypothetical protein
MLIAVNLPDRSIRLFNDSHAHTNTARTLYMKRSLTAMRHAIYAATVHRVAYMTHQLPFFLSDP